LPFPIAFLGFLAPAILHHLPQVSVFGLALGGAVVVHQRCPFGLNLTLIALMTYMGAVWVLSPLQQALAVDPGAALVLAALVSWALVPKLLPNSLHNSQAG
jgi:hypothetical protein